MRLLQSVFSIRPFMSGFNVGSECIGREWDAVKREIRKDSLKCGLKLLKRPLQSAARVSKSEPVLQRWLPPANTLGSESYPVMKTQSMLSALSAEMCLILKSFTTWRSKSRSRRKTWKRTTNRAVWASACRPKFHKQSSLPGKMFQLALEPPACALLRCAAIHA